MALKVTSKAILRHLHKTVVSLYIQRTKTKFKHDEINTTVKVYN